MNTHVKFNKALLVIIIFITASANIFAQAGIIKGKVLTSDGHPAELVNVGLKGTVLGSVTNSKGEYEIKNVGAGSYLLVVSYVGLETKEINIEINPGSITNVPVITLKENAQELQEVVVSDQSKRLINIQSEFVAKMPLKEIENPQVYNTVSSQIIQEQGITNFDDALKNVPGIERLWESTGRGGDGSSYYSLRGFETQSTMVNGIPGLTNGSLDPANIERIEVIKGPSGTLFGSSLISFGGLINTVTKKPYKGFGGEVNYTSGSFGLNRISADVNIPLSKEEDITVRINSSYHSEGSFQDAGFKKSFFIAPSLSYKVNNKLSFLINLEYIDAEGTNPVMLFLNRSNPVEYKNVEDLNYDNKLSLTSNDLSIKNPSYNLQGFINYKISENWASQTVLSRGSAKSDGYYSYLWDNYLVNGEFSLFISDQNSETITTDIQQNFTGNFTLGNLRNRIVIGFDYFQRHSINNSTGYPWLHNVTPQGEINYIDPYSGITYEPRYLSRQSVDELLASSARSNNNVKNAEYSVYISDVINITPELLAMASLRVDYFDTEGDVTIDTDDYNQTAFSPKFGAVYQIVHDKLSVFANYMNGFRNVAPAQVADKDGSNPATKTFEPAHANQFEFGVKTNFFEDKLISTISYYDIKAANILISDPENVNNTLQGGEAESKGFEIDITANPVVGVDLIAGYSYNDSKVLKGELNSIWFQEGKRPVESGPQNLFNAWSTYRFTQGALRGFGFGLGVNSASELIVVDSDITGRFVLPAYTVFNYSLFYSTNTFRVTLNANNATDKEYYKGYSTINPQKPRNYKASFAFKF